MKRLALIFLVVLSLAMACSRKARVIPYAKMKAIYTEMLLLDQWIGRDWKETRVADTSLVYGPLLRKYGYNEEDYRKSVAHYMENPEAFSKMFEEIGKEFSAKAKDIEKEEKLKAQLDSVRNVIMSRPFPRAEIFYDLAEKPYFGDLSFEQDSLGRYIAKRTERDTSYQGPMIIIKEDLEQASDSVDNKSGIPDKTILHSIKDMD